MKTDYGSHLWLENRRHFLRIRRSVSLPLFYPRKKTWSYFEASENLHLLVTPASAISQCERPLCFYWNTGWTYRNSAGGRLALQFARRRSLPANWTPTAARRLSNMLNPNGMTVVRRYNNFPLISARIRQISSDSGPEKNCPSNITQRDRF